jgi:hypothetical protein
MKVRGLTVIRAAFALDSAAICQPVADVSPGCRGLYRQPPPTGSWACEMKSTAMFV